MRWLLIAVVTLLTARAAAAECKKAAAGKPIYRETREPLFTEPGTPPEPTESYAIYPDGSWIATRPSDTEVGATLTFSGCLSPFALRELNRAVGRARFGHPRGPVAVCAALPTHRVTYAAPRRGKKVTVDAPCGVPVDAATGALVACAEAARQDPPPADADLRAICRGR